MKSAIPTKAAILAVSLTSLCQLGADELTSPTATEPKWRDQQAGAGQALEQMTVDELEAYLIPPVGTGREDVESFFGFAFEEGGVKLDEDTKVTGYALFYPVHIEVIYEEGKVAKAAMHHRVDLTEWQSDLQLEIMEARQKSPGEIDEWLKQGYLHFIRGRNLLKAVQFPAWHQPPTQEGQH